MEPDISIKETPETYIIGSNLLIAIFVGTFSSQCIRASEVDGKAASAFPLAETRCRSRSVAGEMAYSGSALCGSTTSPSLAPLVPC
jgi:hypothetical protein